MSRLSISLVLLLGLVVCPAEARGPRQQRLPWEALGPAVKGKKISMVMPDGTEIRGKVLAVQSDGLRVKMSWTTNVLSVGMGEQLIPRDAVSVVKVQQRGWKWRAILTAAAPFALAFAVGAAAGDLPEQGAEGAGAVGAGVLGSMALGYYAGWKLDGQDAVIEVIR